VYGHIHRRHAAGHSRTTAGLGGHGLSRWHAHPRAQRDHHGVGRDHLVFADLRSPRTIANLEQNSAIEINVVDRCTRKGYRLKGVATVLESGALLDDLVAFDTPQGQCDAPRRTHTIVIVSVQRALPLVSLAYDRDVTADHVRTQWEAYYQHIRPQR